MRRISGIKNLEKTSALSTSNVLKQIMEDLNLFVEVFILDAKLPILKLRVN